MRKKVLWFYSFDIKSIIYTIVFVSSIGALIYYLDYIPEKEPEYIKEFDRETYGKVYLIKKETTVSQTETGHHTSIFAYTIKYSFIVADKTYHGKVMIKNITGNLKYLSYIKDNLNKPIFTIKYLSADPEENYLMYSE